MESDLETYGLRAPTPIRPSGDATFDTALAQLVKKCEAAFKKGRDDIKLPARLTKLKPGDDERVLAQLDPALDLGACEFDYDRGTDKAYTTAWNGVRAQYISRQYFLACLARVALATDVGEARVRELLATHLAHWFFARIAIEEILASARPVGEDTLEVAARALEIAGKPSELHMTWLAAARAAMRLPVSRAAELLIPRLATDRGKAVTEAIGTDPSKPLDPAWRGGLLELAGRRNEWAPRILVRLPPEPEISLALANLLAAEAAQYTFFLSTWAFDYLLQHGADDPRVPADVAAAIAAERDKQAAAPPA